MTTPQVLFKLAKFLTSGAVPQAANGQIALWLTRLQRDDNPWLKAERMEQQGRLAAARWWYQQDAEHQRVRGLLARVAVAEAASAGITERLGDVEHAREEWQRAAEHFCVHAEQAAQWSLREAAWAYERAAALYQASGLPAKTEEMRRCADELNGYLALPMGGLDAAPFNGEAHAQ